MMTLSNTYELDELDRETIMLFSESAEHFLIRMFLSDLYEAELIYVASQLRVTDFEVTYDDILETYLVTLTYPFSDLAYSAIAEILSEHSAGWVLSEVEV